jgi:hypothetical protein
LTFCFDWPMLRVFSMQQAVALPLMLAHATAILARTKAVDRALDAILGIVSGARARAGKLAHASPSACTQGWRNMPMQNPVGIANAIPRQ